MSLPFTRRRVDELGLRCVPGAMPARSVTVRSAVWTSGAPAETKPSAESCHAKAARATDPHVPRMEKVSHSLSFRAQNRGVESNHIKKNHYGR